MLPTPDPRSAPSPREEGAEAIRLVSDRLITAAARRGRASGFLPGPPTWPSRSALDSGSAPIGLPPAALPPADLIGVAGSQLDRLGLTGSGMPSPGEESVIGPGRAELAAAPVDDRSEVSGASPPPEDVAVRPRGPANAAVVGTSADDRTTDQPVDRRRSDRTADGAEVPVVAPAPTLGSTGSVSPPDPSTAEVAARPDLPLERAPLIRGAAAPPIPNYSVAADDGRASDPFRESASSGAPLDEGGSGSPDSAWASGSEPREPMPDLAKTHELLQQVLDALRKQSTSQGGSLPTAGPPVYADRS